MQGVVTDDKGAYVKAAIVKLIKVRDSNEESEPEAVTYAETDEEGRFVFRELNSDEKYFIEICVDKKAELEEPGEDDLSGDNSIIDSLATNNMIDDTIRGSISICNLNYLSGLNLKDKPYLTKSNLW